MGGAAEYVLRSADEQLPPTHPASHVDERDYIITG
jgi:hypothetical protein